jgi:nucleotide-binding universal stress UspA family protein
MHSPGFSPPAPKSVVGRIKTSYPRILHLLVPLDFSGMSRQALRYAVPIAQKFSARIHLVHVLVPGRKRTEAEQDRLKAEALRRLDDMAEQILPPRLQTKNLVLTGDPAREILVAASRLDADLIVLTTKGESSLRRRLLGSTAEYVMRHAECPVMSIRRHGA